MTRVVISTEAPAAPILVQPYAHGLAAGRGGRQGCRGSTGRLRPMTAFNFGVIRALAQLRWKSEDLIALSEENDPFFCGRPSHRAAGEWFAALWTRFGFSNGMHLRRAHYVLVSQKEPVLLPLGTPYLNTEACWKYLVQASKRARYLALVPLDAFVDRRNPPAQLFAPPFGGRLGGWIEPWIAGGSIHEFSLPSDAGLRWPSSRRGVTRAVAAH